LLIQKGLGQKDKINNRAFKNTSVESKEKYFQRCSKDAQNGNKEASYFPHK